MRKKKTRPGYSGFTQQQAKEMHQLLTEIYFSLKDRYRNKKLKQVPFIELALMTGIEKHILKKQKKNTEHTYTKKLP